MNTPDEKKRREDELFKKLHPWTLIFLSMVGPACLGWGLSFYVTTALWWEITLGALFVLSIAGALLAGGVTFFVVDLLNRKP